MLSAKRDISEWALYFAKVGRCHIVGGPGSGKSTLAKELGAWMGATVYHLDLVAFEEPNFAERPLAERCALVHQIASQPRWITEGIFVGWTEELLQAADAIIWIDDTNWPTAVWRITKRFLRGGIDEVKRQPGARKFNRFGDYALRLRQLAGEFRSSRDYYGERSPGANDRARPESRWETARFLEPYRTKVIHFQKSGDIRELERQIIDRQRAPAPEWSPQPEDDLSQYTQ